MTVRRTPAHNPAAVAMVVCRTSAHEPDPVTIEAQKVLPGLVSSREVSRPYCFLMGVGGKESCLLSSEEARSCRPRIPASQLGSSDGSEPI